MSDTQEYNFKVIKVSNGWVVSSSYGGPMSTMVVPEDGDLAGFIAAALVSGKLEAANRPRIAEATGQSYSQLQSQLRDQMMSQAQNIYAAQPGMASLSGATVTSGSAAMPYKSAIQKMLGKLTSE